MSNLPIATYPLLHGLSIDILEINHGITDSVVYKFSDSPKVYETHIGYDFITDKALFGHPTDDGYGTTYYYLNDFISTGN